jgi:hypothetical protein
MSTTNTSPPDVIQAASHTAIHELCEPRLIGGVLYYCRQPFIDVPAALDAPLFVARLPWAGEAAV